MCHLLNYIHLHGPCSATNRFLPTSSYYCPVHAGNYYSQVKWLTFYFMVY